MISRRCLVTFYVFILKSCFVNYVHLTFFYKEDNAHTQIPYIQPWLGILKVKSLADIPTEAATGIVLIKKKVAIGVADEINGLDRKNLRSTTTAIFHNAEKEDQFYNYRDILPWKSYVVDFFIHPQYDKDTKNTIGLVVLDTDDKVPDFYWNPVKRPMENHFKERNKTFYVGYIDSIDNFHQVIKEVHHVGDDYCRKFYQLHEINFPNLWPVHTLCFEDTLQTGTCVYDTGMAVATNPSGNWTLVAISTSGPGCSLPARFIEVYPYLSWIDSFGGEDDDIIFPDSEEIQYRRADSWKSVNYEDMDHNMFSYAVDENIEMLLLKVDEEIFTPDKKLGWKKPLQIHLTQETAEEMRDKYCTNSETRRLYSSEDQLKFTKLKYQNYISLYSVTVMDVNIKDLICVYIKANCSMKSKTEIFFQQGFKQEDVPLFIKHISVPNDVVSNKAQDKIVHLFDGYFWYERDQNRTVTIWFKFIFESGASIQLDLFHSIPPKSISFD